MKKLLVAFVLISIFYSCDNHYFIESYTFDNEWLRDEKLDFETEITEPTDDYEIQFVLRHNNEYPYRNFILFIELEDQIDTIEYELADIHGRWLGHGFGSEKEIVLEYRKNYHFKDKGLKNISVQQGMRKDTLYGITDFSVIINKKN